MATTRILKKPSHLVDSTSNFRRKDVDALKITFEDISDWYDDVQLDNYDNSLLIRNMDRQQLLSESENLDAKEHTIADYVSNVLIKELAVAGKREKITDAFVNYLLGTLQFNIYPLSLQIKSDCFFKVHNKIVTSESDFAICKKRMFAIIDEDKHIHNIEHATGWGEYQIAGKILAAAYVNNNSINRNYEKQTIYAIRVIGTRFTFYKAIISYEYIESLSEGFSDEHMYIYRYPPWNKQPGPENIPCLDYSDPADRRRILRIMVSIRDRVINDDLY